MILDTQFLGQLVESDPAAQQTVSEIEQTGRPTRVPTAVVAEIHYGLATMADDDPELADAYRRLFRSTSILAPDEGVAKRAGRLRGSHEASQRLPELDGADPEVAAHGLSLDEPVVSNDEDFQRVDGLSVVSF